MVHIQKLIGRSFYRCFINPDDEERATGVEEGTPIVGAFRTGTRLYILVENIGHEMSLHPRNIGVDLDNYIIAVNNIYQNHMWLNITETAAQHLIAGNFETEEQESSSEVNLFEE